MTEFMNWLRVELLRLRSFDWGRGYRVGHWLKDGVAKFSSHYATAQLAAKIGIVEADLLTLIDSPAVLNELGEKGFIISWKEESLTLTWLEEGIREMATKINQHFFEDDGKFYSESRITDTVTYLDGTERVIQDTGPPKRASITEEDFKEALWHIRRMNGKEE